MLRTKKINGLTLVELIVSITILTVILLTLLSLNKLNIEHNKKKYVKSQMSNCASAVDFFIFQKKIKTSCTLYAYQLKKNCRWIVGDEQYPKTQLPIIKVICSLSDFESDKLDKNVYVALSIKLLYENAPLLEYTIMSHS